MAFDLENQLTAGMHERVHGMDLGADVLDRATRRHGRRVTAVRIGYGVGVAGLAGVLAAGFTVRGGDPAQPQAGTATSTATRPAAQTPAMRLAGAVTASTTTSYRLTLVNRGQSVTPGEPKGPLVETTWEVAFDPRTRTGWAKTDHEWGTFHELLVDGTRYEGTEPRADGKRPPGEHEPYSRYGQSPGTFDRLTFGRSGDPVLTAVAADPAGLLEALRRVEAVVTEQPDESLRFTYTVTQEKQTTVVNGEVKLDKEGRIASVSTTAVWESTVKGPLVRSEMSANVTVSGYGEPVTVQRPADVVPAD